MARYSPNPFYVQPGGDLTQGLSGLGQVLAENRAANEEKAKAEAEAQRQAQARQAAIDAVRSGDPMRVAEVSLQYPDLAENMANQTGMINDQRKQEAFDYAMQFDNAADDSQREALVAQRVEALRNQGRDFSHTLQSWRDYQANPEKELKSMRVFAAMNNPKRWQAAQEAMRVDAPEIREFKEGDRIVTKQFDPTTGSWNPVADAARFNPNSGTTVNVNSGPSLTPGQEAVDKQFAKDIYTPYVLGGGASDSNKGIEQLEFATEALTTGKPLTGPLIGMMPDFAANFVNPESVNVREAVEEVVQRNLREVLGAQFTEKEGEKLIARAYNPSQSEEVNRERLTRLLNAIKGAAKAKAEAVSYFEENGTMRGFRGRIPTMSDFEQAVSTSGQSGNEGGEGDNDEPSVTQNADDILKELGIE